MAAFKGSVYCRKWVYEGKKRKAWGVRYSVNGKVVRKIVADTRAGAEVELEQLKEDHKTRRLGLVEGKTLRDLAGPFLEHKRAQERDLFTLSAEIRAEIWGGSILKTYGSNPAAPTELFQ